MSKDEEKEEAAVSTVDDAEQVAVTGEETQEEEKPEEKPPAEEEKGEEKEEKEEKAEVTLPELTDEQRAVLAKDPSIQEMVRGEGSADLDAFIKETLEKHDQTKEQAKAQAEERKTLEEAEKAYREDNDPGPLAQIAAENIAKARQRAAVAAEADEAIYERVRPFVEAEYGDTVRAMKPEEVKALDAMPLAGALQELARRKAETSGGAEMEAASKAIQSAATAGAARSDATGNLPGGSAQEDVGEDIGTLMRQGLEDSLDVEEAVGG